MTTPSILAVPGLESTSQEFRHALWEMAHRNGWDVDAIAAVISIESGFRTAVKNPNSTASGLIQFIDSTAKSLGVAGGSAEIRTMSALQQLPLVERYYQRVFAGRVELRPVDYYLAVWGSGVGKPETHVLARADDEKRYSGGKHNLYTLNAGLDADADGLLEVADVRAKLERQQAKAAGRRLDASKPPAGGGTLVAAAVPALVALGIAGAVVLGRAKR